MVKISKGIKLKDNKTKLKEYILEIKIEEMNSIPCPNLKFSLNGESKPSQFGFGFPLENLDRIDELIKQECNPNKWGFGEWENIKITPKIVKDFRKKSIKQEGIFAWV